MPHPLRGHAVRDVFARGRDIVDEMRHGLPADLGAELARFEDEILEAEAEEIPMTDQPPKDRALDDENREAKTDQTSHRWRVNDEDEANGPDNSDRGTWADSVGRLSSPPLPQREK